MPRTASAAFAVLVAIACVNEVESVSAAASTSMRVMSTEEIRNHTTMESALKLVLSLNDTHMKPELAALLQSKFAHVAASRAVSNLRAVGRHGQEPAGYGAVEGAMQMLAEMMMEANGKLDLEISACNQFDQKQMELMKQTRNDIALMNTQANLALAAMLKAQGLIASLGTQLHQIKDQLENHHRQCTEDIASTKKLLAIVTADVNVMGVILNLTQCGGDDAGTAPAALVQTDSGSADSSNVSTLVLSNASDELLVNCAHCLGGNGMVMLQNGKLQLLLNKLQSMYAHDYLQKQLKISFRQAVRGRNPVALSQIGVAHQLKLVRAALSPIALAEVGLVHRLRRRSQNETNQTLEEAGLSVDVADVPQEPQPMDCIPTTKCTLGAANCPMLQERFEGIHGGLVEKKDGLTNELAELEMFCEEAREIMQGQIADMEQRLGQEQANLAQSTGDKSEAESGAHNKAAQYDELHLEYAARMKACCDNQNELKSEKCALEKIRGELLKLEGVDLFVVDCETSEWEEQECTVTCAGGSRVSIRSILVGPENGGMSCPALEKTEPCNEFECPVECVLHDWEGWSACNAECGGGVRERSRSIRVDPQHGGEACGALTDSEACNNQACDADCVLQDWTEWTACSKYCDGGTQNRLRDIAVEAKGTGTCFEPDSEHRQQFHPCNTYTCESILPENRPLLYCDSKVDVIILVDGSGNIGQKGWEQTKAFAHNVIEHLHGSDDKVHVALQVFSKTVNWVSHLTNDTEKVAALSKDMAWPKSVTYTHRALSQAESELIRGRQDANSVVIVITDGAPSYPYTTKLAATKLKKKARVIWVPVGPNAPVKMIKDCASVPVAEHIVKISFFNGLSKAKKINQLLADSCPIVE